MSPLLLPFLWTHARRDDNPRRVLAQRLGYWPDPAPAEFPRDPTIWVHAVSVGEVKAAEAIVAALDAASCRAAILLTTTTSTGQQYARRQLGKRATVCYAPVDLWWVVGRFLRAHRPRMLICLETEIWPNWILQAHRAGINAVFLNGRISSRSIRSYLKIRPLLQSVFKLVDGFSMISQADADRIVSLGAPQDRVWINGNVKMDIRGTAPQATTVEAMKRLFAVGERTPVFIGGSVRGAEIDPLLEVYRRLAGRIPELLFIIAPRHIEKTPLIVERAGAMGIAVQRRTELAQAGTLRTAPLVILDTIGELRDVYGIASVVFGGASLVPLGGQNVIEAAVWAKPVLFGPHMDDFQEARVLLENCGGGICVKDAHDLGEQAYLLLMQADRARRMGRLAKEAVLASQGAADRHARVALRLLSTAPPERR